MMRLLLTGGIGSGKTQVARTMREHGIPVYDSDSMARELYDRDEELVGRMVAAMGCSVLGAEGMIDRKALADVIFSDPEKLRELEAIVHPAVYRDFERFCEENEDAQIVAIESAIALQRGYPEGLVDEVVYVDAPEELRVARAALRDSRSQDETRKRVAAQPSVAGDPRITRVLQNNGSLEDLERATEKLIEILKIEYNEDRSR